MGAEIPSVNSINYSSYEDLCADMKKYVVDSLQSFIFLDFSYTNDIQGRTSYGHGLHKPQPSTKLTPYEECLTSLNRVITHFDDDDIYPVFKFGQKQG